MHSFDRAIHIATATPTSKVLADVRALWRAHSATLGFFPDGAFEEHAARGRILVATNTPGNLLGYLLFRLARGRAVIVHLCCEERARGAGVARRLFEEFRRRTKDLSGAEVRCRTDFAAANLWDRLGFVRVHERAAKLEGREIGIWKLDYGHPDLFTSATHQATIAVLDANVFFDLVDATQDEAVAAGAGAHPLQADWVQATVTLAITSELRAEIARNSDPQRVKRLRAVAGTFHEVKARPEDVEDLQRQVEAIMGPPRSQSDRSDRRHLALAIAADVPVFLTRDTEVLDFAESFRQQFGLRVLAPVALINDIDASEQPNAYEPARLEGSGLRNRSMRASEIDVLKQQFLAFRQQESNGGLPVEMRRLLSRPRTASLQIIEMPDATALALFGVEREADVYRVRILRVGRGGLGATLVHHLLWRLVTDAREAAIPIVSFEDAFADGSVIDALQEVGFVRDGDRWIKVMLEGCLAADVASERMRTLGQRAALRTATVDTLVDALRTAVTADAEQIARLELLLWPLKLRDAAIPCYIVPIRPYFAKMLFDTAMAAEELFDTPSDLLLRLHNVYYRSPHQSMRAPARVLWYVSKGKGPYSHAMHVAAASSLTGVVVGAPKSLYDQFRRYGVYSYRDVERIGTNDPRGQAMAFTFARAELLHRPIPHAQLKEHCRHPLASPAEISGEQWCRLYEMGGCAADR